MEQGTIRIAIAEDQLLLRKAMVELLEMEEGFQIVFEAASGKELLQYLKHGIADLVLTDLEMPEVGGLEVITELKEQKAGLPVVVLSSHEEDATILTCIHAGARGYLVKNSHPDEVISTIHAVIQNGFYFKESISNLLLRGVLDQSSFPSGPTSVAKLANREMEVLELICQELTNKEIADKLHLSPRTVESYRRNMLEKVGAKNTVGLVLYALRNGIIELE